MMKLSMTMPAIVDKEYIEFQLHGETYSKIKVKTVRIHLVNHMKPLDLSIQLTTAIRDGIQELEDELGRT